MIRETMQNAGLEIFAEIGLVLFIIGFILVIARALLMREKDADEAARLPLEDEKPEEVM